jgi:hypothetical protein
MGRRSETGNLREEAHVAEIRVERKERRSILPWILGLLLLALIIWGVSEMMGDDDDVNENNGAAAVGTAIEQPPPALRQYAQAVTPEVTEVFEEAA